MWSQARLRSVGLHATWACVVAGADRLDRRLRDSGLPPGAVLGVIVPAWYAGLGILERSTPADPQWHPEPDEARTDAAFFGVISLVALGGQSVGEQLLGRSDLRRGKVRRRRGERLGTLGGAAAAVLAFDLVHTLLHRLSHEWGPAWRVHSVHHSPERLHILNATRFHPLESFIEGVLEGAALGFVGLTPAQHLTHKVARATYGQLQHANIELDSGPLDHFFATPDLHRWHHSVIYAEGDTNFGAVTSIWDRLTGSFFRPDMAFEGDMGVGRMPDFPASFVDLLKAPVDWPQIRERNAETWYGPSDSPTSVRDVGPG